MIDVRFCVVKKNQADETVWVIARNKSFEQAQSLAAQYNVAPLPGHYHFEVEYYCIDTDTNEIITNEQQKAGFPFTLQL